VGDQVGTERTYRSTSRIGAIRICDSTIKSMPIVPVMVLHAYPDDALFTSTEAAILTLTVPLREAFVSWP
jgi:hypothetical protein